MLAEKTEKVEAKKTREKDPTRREEREMGRLGTINSTLCRENSRDTFARIDEEL
tara:strand:+ start:3153 stop:3314 length:162 start_codon:yes stop_codon:yes gene_type:complete